MSKTLTATFNKKFGRILVICHLYIAKKAYLFHIKTNVYAKGIKHVFLYRFSDSNNAIYLEKLDWLVTVSMNLTKPELSCSFLKTLLGSRSERLFWGF